jgi:hypothetical protein
MLVSINIPMAFATLMDHTCIVARLLTQQTNDKHNALRSNH